MPVYVVERYWPGVCAADVDDLCRRLREAVREESVEGEVVYLGSILLDADEVVQCRFAAVDVDAVRRVNDLAAARYDRILQAYLSPE